MIWPLSVDFIFNWQLRRSKSFSKVFEALKMSQNDTAVFLLLVLFLYLVLFLFKLTFNISFCIFLFYDVFFYAIIFKILKASLSVFC